MIKRLNSRVTLTQYRKDNNIPTNKELKEIVLKYIKYKDWYKNSLNMIKDKFPYNYDLMLKLISVTSQQNNLKSNIDFALMSYQSIINNNSPYELNYGIVNTSIQGNIKRILSGKLPHGNKIKPFTLALRGDLSQVVIDTHMIKFFTNNKKRVPTITDIRHITTIINHIAQDLNLKPSEVQACIWVYIKENMEYSRDKSNFDYAYYLKDINGEKFNNYKFINNDTIDLLNIDVRTFNSAPPNDLNG